MNNTTPKLTTTTCRVTTCGRTIIGDALVPSIENMIDGGGKFLVSVRVEEWACCHSCARAIAKQIPGTRFFSLAGTQVEIARRLKAAADREVQREKERRARREARKAERSGVNAFQIGSVAEAFSEIPSVKTEGRDGRKLVGAAANAVVRKAITKIADQNEIALREDAEKKAAREKAVAEKKSALDARNAAMTAAAVSGR